MKPDLVGILALGCVLIEASVQYALALYVAVSSAQMKIESLAFWTVDACLSRERRLNGDACEQNDMC
jgi:site-specific recombinase